VGLAQFEDEALKLDVQERACLVVRLLDSIGEESNDYDEEAWIIEAEHRYAAYKEGNLQSRDFTLVMRDAHQALKKIIKQNTLVVIPIMQISSPQ
jgi:putative addiction module component (TIGR02574 family)